MIPILFAGLGSGWSLIDILKGVIIIAAVCGIVFIALRVFGITLPVWLWQIVGIVAVCIVIRADQERQGKEVTFP